MQIEWVGSGWGRHPLWPFLLPWKQGINLTKYGLFSPSTGAPLVHKAHSRWYWAPQKLFLSVTYGEENILDDISTLQIVHFDDATLIPFVYISAHLEISWSVISVQFSVMSPYTCTWVCFGGGSLRVATDHLGSGWREMFILVSFVMYLTHW